MKSHVIWCLLTTAIVSQLSVATSHHILAIEPLDIASHQRFSRPILRELASRGHSVTVITPIEDPDPLPNYKQVIVPRIPLWDAVPLSDNDSLSSPEKNSHRSVQADLRNRTLAIADSILSSKAMQDFMSKDDTRYNLIICELFHIEAFYIFSHIYKAPIVGFSSLGHTHVVNQIMGNPYELSYVPNENLDLPKRFKMLDRLKNTYWTMVDLVERGWWVNSEQEELVKKHFSYLSQPLPTLKELEKNIVLVLVNSHFSIDTARPMVPGIVEVGGVHIEEYKKAKERQSLPKDIKTFLDTSKQGTVYVNFEDDVIKSKICPERVKMFLNAFKRLKHRVVWSYKGEKPSEIPNNVIMVKSINHSDMLANPQIEVFVTHGGQIHVQEAISRSIRILCIPLYGDQISTCSKAVQGGYGKELALEDLTEESIASSVAEVSENSRILEKMEMASALFNDRLSPPLYTAIYWTEFAGKEADHMKSPALELSLMEYYLLDTIAIMSLALYYAFKFISWLWWNVVLRKKIPRDDIQHLIEKQKPH